jgi:hypothetical protein
MRCSLKPKEIRLRFECPSCGKDVWIFSQNKHGGVAMCPHCHTNFGFGAKIVQTFALKKEK